MATRITRAALSIDADFAHFIETMALPGTGIDAGTFWQALDSLVHEPWAAPTASCSLFATRCKPALTSGIGITRASRMIRMLTRLS